jgi:hypothetical protein
MEAATQEGYAADEGEIEFEDENKLEEGEVQQPTLGRPRQYNRSARPPPRPVCDDEHVAKLKLNIAPFEGRYNPDAYLTWELEVEQCLHVYDILGICVLVLLLVSLQILLLFGGMNIIESIMVIFIYLDWFKTCHAYSFCTSTLST